MLSENIKKLRTARGLSQEELAIKINVVRQTVSKWEKGLSVPDSQMLIKLAEELNTSVSVLLGESAEEEITELKAIAAKLELVNRQLAVQNDKNRKVWQIFLSAALIVCMGLLMVWGAECIFRYLAMSGITADPAWIGGYDGPTNIFISDIVVNIVQVIFIAGIGAASAIGLWVLRRK